MKIKALRFCTNYVLPHGKLRLVQRNRTSVLKKQGIIYPPTIKKSLKTEILGAKYTDKMAILYPLKFQGFQRLKNKMNTKKWAIFGKIAQN